MRYVHLSLLAVILTLSPAPAADDADQAKEAGKTYDVQLDRDNYAVGERFQVRGFATQTQTLLGPKPDGKASEADKKQKSLKLSGDVKILEVGDESEALKVELRVDSFEYKGDEGDADSTGAQQAKKIKKGDILTIIAGEDGPQKVTVAGSDLSLDGDAFELLGELVPLEDREQGTDKKPDLMKQLTGEKKWTVGETRKVEPKKLPMQFDGAKMATLKATLLGLEQVEGVECHHMKIEFKAEGIEMKDSPAGDKAMAAFEARAEGWLPSGSDAPARKSTERLVFRAEFSGEKAALFSGVRVVQEVERLLIPIQSER